MRVNNLDNLIGLKLSPIYHDKLNYINISSLFINVIVGTFPISLTPIPRVCATSQKGPEILKVFAELGKLGFVKTNESNFEEETK